jgi:hypothetical protein
MACSGNGSGWRTAATAAAGGQKEIKTFWLIFCLSLERSGIFKRLTHLGITATPAGRPI